jgi:CubicO group peptidase (beta-lactamase class C family)
VTTALEELLFRHIEAGTIPGAVALLASGGVEVVAAGMASINGEPMRDDAIMRIQSMTKPITSVAALSLVEASRLALDESVEEWLPDWRTAGYCPAPLPRSTTPCRPVAPSPFDIY